MKALLLKCQNKIKNLQECRVKEKTQKQANLFPQSKFGDSQKANLPFKKLETLLL